MREATYRRKRARRRMMAPIFSSLSLFAAVVGSGAIILGHDDVGYHFMILGMLYLIYAKLNDR